MLELWFVAVWLGATGEVNREQFTCNLHGKQKDESMGRFLAAISDDRVRQAALLSWTLLDGFRVRGIFSRSSLDSISYLPATIEEKEKLVALVRQFVTTSFKN